MPQTKAALCGLTVALAGEWAPQGVRVNTVAPGYIATEMNRTTRQDRAFVDAVHRRTPMGRFGTPEEVAWAVTFLASKPRRLHHRPDAVRRRRLDQLVAPAAGRAGCGRGRFPGRCCIATGLGRMAP